MVRLAGGNPGDNLDRSRLSLELDHVTAFDTARFCGGRRHEGCVVPADSRHRVGQLQQPFLVRLTHSKVFHDTVIAVIIASAVLIGLETNRQLHQAHQELFTLLDRIFLLFFVVEISLRIFAESKRNEDGNKQWYRFFLDPWHVFDFAIIAICILPLHDTFFVVLRIARILRVLLLIDELPRLQVLVTSLLNSLPSMGYVSLLLLLNFYSSAIKCTDFFDVHNFE